MKTPKQIKAETSKRIEAVIKSYLHNTPLKITRLREMEIPSAITRQLSKNELASITDVMPQNIGKIEKPYGEPHSLNVSIKLLIKIAVIFDVSLDYLVGLTDDTKPVKQPKAIEKVDEGENMISLQKQILKVLQERLPINA